MKTNRWTLFIVVVTLVVLLDRGTKLWAKAHLAPPDSNAMGFIEFDYYENTGIAFGLLEGLGSFFVPLSVLAMVLLIAVYRSIPGQDRLSLLLFCLIMGGAIGNLYDRVHYHYVVDFIYIKIWPFPFNLADSCITVGAIAWMAISLLDRREAHAPDPV